jgi:N-acetylglucosaminyl-diphospho-decaprenol L-rhamnosyltransferase
MNNEITVVITTFKSDKKIESCLNSIDPQIKVVIVENSNSHNFKIKMEKNFKNVECILPGENLGYSKGNNLGLSLVKTKYALILNPDTVLDTMAINNFFEFQKKIFDFAIVGPNQDEQINVKFKKDYHEVEYIKGYAMFLNLDKFSKIGFFDENFFLYLEEIDLCKRIKKINEKIYVDPKIQILHLGGQSVDLEYNQEVELNRNWHWMWSLFYYNKKHYGYLLALALTIPKLFSAIFNIIIFLFLLNKKKKDIYLKRLSGLTNSIIGKKSWYRPNLH